MEILRNINKNIIDITNANNDIDAGLLKDNIKLYFDNISDKENISNKKREKYYENYENKRVEQNINYDNWLREKTDLMETFKLDKTKTALHNYLKLKPPKYNNNLNLYSYLDIIIDDEKVINMPKQQNIQPIKPKVLPNKADKCPESKKKECKDKGKICNPESGRCIKEPVVKPVVEPKVAPVVKSDVEPKVAPVVKSDKCSEAKKKECEIKGKKCNPDTGRCIKK